MEQNAENVPFNLLFGMENIATTAFQELIGILHNKNAYHAREAKSTIQSKTFVFALLKILLCFPMELALFVIDPNIGMKEIKDVKLVEKDLFMITRDTFVSVHKQLI